MGGSDLENYRGRKLRIRGVGFWVIGGRILGILYIFNQLSGTRPVLKKTVLKKTGLQQDCPRSTEAIPESDLFCFPSESLADGSFDWGRVSQEAKKFSAVPCFKKPDRQFIYKAIALTQTTIPPFALWDALEAVKQIGPAVPIAYFRTVLRDNCRKAGVDLHKALRTVRVPTNFV